MTNSSLQLDSQGNPHVAYGGDHLHYAWYDGIQWHYQIADQTTGIGSTSLALDAIGNPHISYASSRGTMYASWDGSRWRIEMVDTVYSWEERALVLDQVGNPHIGYYNSINRDVRYAFWAGGEWNLPDGGQRQGDFGYGLLSLALDAGGHPHFSYFDDTNEDLKYAFWNGVSWQIQTVDTGGSVGWQSSLNQIVQAIHILAITTPRTIA